MVSRIPCAVEPLSISSFGSCLTPNLCVLLKAPALRAGLAHFLWPESFLVKQSMGLLVGTRGAKATPVVLSEPLHVMLGAQSPGQLWEGCVSCPLQTHIAVFLLPPILQTRGPFSLLLRVTDVHQTNSGVCIPPELQHKSDIVSLNLLEPVLPVFSQAGCRLPVMLEHT